MVTCPSALFNTEHMICALRVVLMLLVRVWVGIGLEWRARSLVRARSIYSRVYGSPGDGGITVRAPGKVVHGRELFFVVWQRVKTLKQS